VFTRQIAKESLRYLGNGGDDLEFAHIIRQK
jgi:hypothetical protein